MQTEAGSGKGVTTGRGVHYVLWTLQVIVAALFIFSGVMKFVMPVAKMQQGPVALPGSFIHFIGICEILGGLGLVLPGWTGIQRRLTPIAAICLVIIMIGATVITARGGMNATVAIPFVVGVLTALIAYGRRSWLRGN